MTRIIAGTARGRRLSVPEAGTRPTTDRVREAVFNILAARVDFDGALVLDLFAGSGALGLEALSRGAGSVVLVESDSRAAKVIDANIRSTGLVGAVVERRRVVEHLRKSGSVADIVFADPPYDLPDEQLSELLQLLAAGRVAPGGTVIIERSTRSAVTAWPEEFGDVDIRRYGETRIELAEFASSVGGAGVAH
ncbi:16S rRNA (guanine(966)-N(2))-methyltransferase RsmD [Williamsia sp. 1135]|uniref:16S rRNA (guanine(966)-N(2))-methyltransferase RsmD n=1 Tax=Williamsia sp. 1135 TaxID=1889262 RepID=UPI000A11B18B|nr:16S rRNA (guanine(966)-N(2))-methyltransferase RsmD [Williamsia sp. 1135]ORM37073.1 16S rRNA (guanine(966)-N(2))-methyltransferase RsmD [Williamsia sp. 1135]